MISTTGRRRTAPADPVHNCEFIHSVNASEITTEFLCTNRVHKSLLEHNLRLMSDINSKRLNLNFAVS